MGDGYQALVDIEAESEEAEILAQRVVDHLSEIGLIMPALDPDSVLGGKRGFRPGHRIKELYTPSPGESTFLTLRTNGMEVHAGPWVNEFGFLFVEKFACPRCKTIFLWEDDVKEQFSDAVFEFYDGVARPVISCPRCKVAAAVQEWRTDNHLGFAYLAFRFWNWDSFDNPRWKIEIPDLISKVLGHDLVLTYGRI